MSNEAKEMAKAYMDTHHKEDAILQVEYECQDCCNREILGYMWDAIDAYDEFINTGGI